jgi:hypothetical protein
MRRTLELLLLAVCVAGCATSPTSNMEAFAQRSANNSFEPFNREFGSPSALVLPVVHDRQSAPAACGAHALASVVNYWRGAGTVAGAEIYAATPPGDVETGYSVAELMTLARAHGLMASGVRLALGDLIRELESGRPVLAPVRVPSIYVQDRTLPGLNAPVVGAAANVIQGRVGWVSERTDLALVNHYVLIVGYDDDQVVVVEPVMGYRTISFERLARYRAPFENAAVVFSAPARPPVAGGAARAPAG